jgi:hypothetical protein
MPTTLAERSAVPFHLGLTEPIDEATILGYPAVEGTYDPVEQIWRLPDGTALTDPKVIKDAAVETYSISIVHGHQAIDDVEIDFDLLDVQ